jgi:DNA-binding ferritin-like protein
MEGSSFGELHDMLDALESNDSRFIENAAQTLLALGSSSGADMLAGLLLALTTT